MSSIMVTIGSWHVVGTPDDYPCKLLVTIALQSAQHLWRGSLESGPRLAEQRANMIRRLCAPAVLTLLLGWSVSASAATVNCPGTLVTTDREFTLDTAVAATCYQF